MIQKGQTLALELFQHISQRLDSKLKTPIKTFFIPLLLGALLAIARRRTVTQWLQAAGLSDDFRNIFYHMPSIGHKSQELFDEMLKCIIEHLGNVLATSSYIRIVLETHQQNDTERKSKVQVIITIPRRARPMQHFVLDTVGSLRHSSSLIRSSAKSRFRLLPNSIFGKKKSTN